MNPGQHWNEILDVLRQSVGHQEVQIWLGDATLVSMNEHELTVAVPNQYYVDWIEENYKAALEEEALRSFNRPMSIILKGQKTPSPKPSPSTPSVHHSQPKQMGVNKNQMFRNFVVGSCNQFAESWKTVWIFSEKMTNASVIFMSHIMLI